MNTMNRIMSAFLLTAAVCMPAMSQTVTVFQKNGETVKYKVSDVEKIVFEGEKPVDETNLLSEKYVPCEAFRNWIDQNLGDGSGYYSLDQAAAYDGTIDITGKTDITDITGIEHFTSLTRLVSENVTFPDFDVAALKNLTYLKIVNNSKCTTLDLSQLVRLESVSLSHDALTTLKLGNNSVLKTLICDTNMLQDIDLTGCTSLESFVASCNNLSNLVLPDSPLKTLAIHTNSNIRSIDVTKVKPTLELLNVNACGLTEFDPTNCPKLDWLECGQNNLKTLDLSGCPLLTSVRFDNTSITEVNLSECVKLQGVYCEYAKLSRLDLSNNPDVNEVNAMGNGLTEINVKGCTNMGYMNLSENKFKQVDISDCKNIWLFYCNRCTTSPEIKVWKEFDIENAATNGFYCDNGKFVYEFSSEQ